MRRSWIALLLLWPLPALPDSYPRQESVDIVHYEIAVDLDESSGSLRGMTRIHTRMRQDGVTGFWLDFAGMRVERVLMAGADRRYKHEGGRLSLAFDRPYDRNEIALVEVRYSGKPAGKGLAFAKNRHGRPVVFAENWPDRAHHWFPCVDHPADKASLEIAVTAPEKYDIVSNGVLVGTRSLLDGRKTTTWRESVPIPVYCMIFGAAEFAVWQEQERYAIPLHYYAYPQDAGVAARKFARTGLMLEVFSRLVGPYPYAKLAQVEATTAIGGMENASAIFYSEAVFERAPSDEAPIPHEIAHQWFGNSVTPADWDHVWVSEGFATYLEALFYEQVEGISALRARMEGYADAVHKLHRKHPAPILDPSVRDPAKKLNANAYQKGAWVLHMLRGLLGDEAFFAGLRRFYSLYRDANADTEDFRKVMEYAGGKPLEGFFRQWLHQAGYPEYRLAWRWQQETEMLEITIRQEQDCPTFDMPAAVLVHSNGPSERHIVRLGAREDRFRLPCRHLPQRIELDPDGWILKTVREETR